MDCSRVGGKTQKPQKLTGGTLGPKAVDSETSNI